MSSRREVFLERYINSLGHDLPADIQDYKEGNIKADQCPLCDESHNLHQLFQYNISAKTSAIVLDAYLCDRCYKASNIVKRKFDVLLQIEPDEVLTTSFRLGLYNNSHKFASDVFKFYTHLTTQYDLYSTNPLEQCYFCGKVLVYDKADRVYINVPVTPGNVISGGKIIACQHHANMCNPPKEEVRERCIQCGSEYPVSIEENSARAKNLTVNKHYCPECTYYKIDSLGPKDALFVPAHLRPRHQPMLRYIQAECSTCGNDFVIDLTLDHNRTLQYYTHRNRTDDEIEFNCYDCYLLGLFTTGTYATKFNEQLLILVKKEGNDYRYQIWRTTMPRELVLKASFVSKSISEAFLAAFEVLTNAKQLPLWE